MPTRSIRRVHRIEASASRIWQALTEAQQLQQWICEAGFIRAELRGPIRLEWSGGLHADGQITQFEVDHLLEFSYRVPAFMDCVSQPTFVRFQLTPGDGYTELELEHREFLGSPNWDAYFHGHRKCWDIDLAELRSLCANGRAANRVLRLEAASSGQDFSAICSDLGIEDEVLNRHHLQQAHGWSEPASSGQNERQSWDLVLENDRLIFCESWDQVSEAEFQHRSLYWKNRLQAWTSGEIEEGSPYE